MTRSVDSWHVVLSQAIDELSGEIVILKKYLESKRTHPEASDDLNSFYKQQEEAWEAIVAKIPELLED